jgi:hypothetical protein
MNIEPVYVVPEVTDVDPTEVSPPVFPSVCTAVDTASDTRYASFPSGLSPSIIDVVEIALHPVPLTNAPEYND